MLPQASAYATVCAVIARGGFMKRNRFNCDLSAKRGCYDSNIYGVRVHQFVGSSRVCVCGETRVPEVQLKFGKFYYDENFKWVKRGADNENNW